MLNITEEYIGLIKKKKTLGQFHYESLKKNLSQYQITCG